MTESQRWSIGFHDSVQNLKASFVEENHGIFGPNRLFNAAFFFVRVLDKR
jgi:hypothetical protein